MKMTGNGGPGRVELCSNDRLIVVLKEYKYGFELDAVPYRVKRTGFFAASYRLLRNQDDLVLTSKQAPFLARYTVSHADGQWIFKTVSIGQSLFILLRGAAKVGHIAPGRWLSFYKKIDIDLPDELSLPAQVFLVWLALRSWRE